jgi:glutamine synthetase
MRDEKDFRPVRQRIGLLFQDADDQLFSPTVLEDPLDCLEEDHEFLLKGDVFTDDALRTWLAYKREHECQQVALRPHPHEFELYYDL